MPTCPVCNGKKYGSYFDPKYMIDVYIDCKFCEKKGFVLNEFEKKEIKMNKAVDDAWEKNHENKCRCER